MINSKAVSSVADTGSREFEKPFSLPRVVPAEVIVQALEARNHSWQNNALIPGWVNPETVSLDRFFTRRFVAGQCYRSLLEIMARDHVDSASYKFIEPAAGDGAFYDLLPEKRRIGIEIVPGRQEFLHRDYLGWTPRKSGYRYAVIGNPPFGYRAWLALAFLNHSATFSDYVAMILPMAFQSDGKGSPKFRVDGAELVLSEPLASDAFVTPSGQVAQVNALWQIWRRGVNKQRPVATNNRWVDLFTVDMRKERLCGQKRLSEANWFLQRTFYGDPPKPVRDFSEVRYVCGYGIVIKNAVEAITEALNVVDWRQYSNLAAHNCRHISMYHICQALSDCGFTDG